MQNKKSIATYIEEIGANGHSIFIAESIVAMGFDRQFVSQFIKKHTSGKSYKETIFNENGKIKEIFGVYGLDFLYAIANDCNADTSDARKKMGRGFQAQELVKAIKEKLKIA